MDEHLNRTRVIEYVQDLLPDTQDVADFLGELARYSAANLSGSRREVLCGITMLRKRSAATVASSGDRALLLDELQCEYGDGPCLRSCREGTLVHVQDFRHEARWLHSDTASNLKAAMEPRTVIDTAVGIIIAQDRCTQDEAFALLKSASSTRNIKVREAAAAIVRSAGAGPVETTSTDATPDPDGPGLSAFTPDARDRAGEAWARLPLTENGRHHGDPHRHLRLEL